MNFMKFFIFLFLAQTLVFGLEVDEKLTLRVLEISATKKTVLVNRGLEDGLVVGDHAKFFLTKGVIARGVVVKASPSRSIWSIYRIIDADEIQKDSVVNIKISTEVKLTDDPTKSVNGLIISDSEMGEPDSITVKDKRSDSDEVSSLISENELSDDFQETNTEVSNVKIDKKNSFTRGARSNHGMEVYSLLSFNSYSGTYSASNNTDFDATSANISYTLGFEKYFPSATSFVKNISLKAHYSGSTQKNGSSVTSTNSATDMGLGINYYFGSGPFQTNSLMYFVDGNFGFSSSTIESQVGTNEPTTLNGTGTFLSVGIGAKYLINKEIGAILKLDYYQTASSFEVEDSISKEITSEELTLAGPRLLFGLSYRFL